jgi:hypothetical protein
VGGEIVVHEHNLRSVGVVRVRHLRIVGGRVLLVALWRSVLLALGVDQRAGDAEIQRSLISNATTHHSGYAVQDRIPPIATHSALT